MLAHGVATRIPRLVSGEVARAAVDEGPAATTSATPTSAPSGALILGGYVKARRLVQVGSAVSGVVQEILAQPGIG